MRKALLLLAVLALAGSAQGAGRRLPAPVLTIKADGLMDITASGQTVALATYHGGDCAVAFFRPAAGRKPTALRRPPCSNEDENVVSDVWLGRTTIAAFSYSSPSPHGEAWQYLIGPRPAGPLRPVGGDWGWTDSEPPWGFGCIRVVVSGGGVIAEAQRPNRLGWEHGLDQPKPTCASSGSTTIELAGAGVPRVVVSGTWEPLATDGKRIALAELDSLARRTGKLELIDVTGTPIAFDQPDPPLVRAATDAWLTSDGLILQAQGSRLYGRGWTTPKARAATVGEGRIVYTAGASLRVRRTHAGPDRLLLTFPPGDVQLAAGSFGVAVALDQSGGKVTLYRLPWRTIDRTLTAS